MDSVLLFVLITLSCLCTADAACIAVNGKLDLSNGNFSFQHVTASSFQGCSFGATYIDLSGNSILTLANDSFYDFYNLQHLNISHNQIYHIDPGTFSSKRNLQTFDASYNAITHLNDSFFESLVNLVTIRLQHNSITDIECNVFHKGMSRLENVDLSFNNLTYFEPWPYIPVQHSQTDGIDLIFNLTHNNISQFRNSKGWLQNLKADFETYVYLQHNKIQTLGNAIINLYDPDFNDNFIAEQGAYRMNTSHNPFICDCNLYEVVNRVHNSMFLYFEVDSYRAYCASPSNFAGVDFIHDMDPSLFVCNVSTEDGCPGGCFCQEQPHQSHLVVDCRNTGLNELPQTLPTPRYGNISLYLDNNLVTRVVERPYSSLLRSLTISGNDVSIIDSNAWTNKLNYLDVSSNKLEYLPKTVQVMDISNVKFTGNQLKCGCNMTWMKDWIELYPNVGDIGVTCDDNGDSRDISKVTDESLSCDISILIIAISVALSALIALVCSGVIIAKRCPYDTKVLLFRFFGAHPRDKYKVDRDDTKVNDVYISCDKDDIQVRQWVTKVLLPKLKEGKKPYSVFCYLTDSEPGANESEEIINNMKKSRRIILLLSPGYFDNEWCLYEADKAEEEHINSNSPKGRVMYLLWNISFKDKINEDPWRSRQETKRILCPDERFFWSKLRYELPVFGYPFKPNRNMVSHDNTGDCNNDILTTCMNSTPMPSTSKLKGDRRQGENSAKGGALLDDFQHTKGKTDNKNSQYNMGSFHNIDNPAFENNPEPSNPCTVVHVESVDSNIEQQLKSKDTTLLQSKSADSNIEQQFKSKDNTLFQTLPDKNFKTKFTSHTKLNIKEKEKTCNGNLSPYHWRALKMFYPHNNMKS